MESDAKLEPTIVISVGATYSFVSGPNIAKKKEYKMVAGKITKAKFTSQ